MNDDRKLTDFRRWLLSILDVLGSDSAKQLECVQSGHVGIDELALQFDDAMHVAKARLNDGSVSLAEFETIKVVDERLDAMSESSESLWTEDAVSNSSEWRRLRMEARRARSTLEQLWL